MGHGSGPDFSEADPGIQLRGRYGEHISRVWGSEVQGQSPLSGDQRRSGSEAPKAERHSLFRCHKEGELWPILS